MDVREKLIEILKKPIFPHELADPTEAVADYLLDSGVTVQEWISVDDMLPEDGDIVLCYMEFGEQRIARWDESENCWVGQLIDYHKEQVTHWMPIPQPPKGE